VQNRIRLRDIGVYRHPNVYEDSHDIAPYDVRNRSTVVKIIARGRCALIDGSDEKRKDFMQEVESSEKNRHDDAESSGPVIAMLYVVHERPGPRARRCKGITWNRIHETPLIEQRDVEMRRFGGDMWESSVVLGAGLMFTNSKGSASCGILHRILGAAFQVLSELTILLFPSSLERCQVAL
jgi:hypothetical protein